MNTTINFSATHGNKVDNESTLEAQEWNQIMGELDTVIAQIPTGGDGSGSGTGTQSVADTHISKSAKGNVEFVTTQEDLNAEGKGGKINIESYSDIQIKPGDDVIFTSSHRPVKNLDEVSVKIHDGEDHPVKLQVNTADIVLTTKDKNLTRVKKDDGSDDPNTAMYNDPAVLNVTVNSAKNTRGYLKVRAQAIDLRSESHGGIALQPKGNDGQGHENKIKFEHGGGDGLEFGTFNTDKTSIFTNEYRFNKYGVWKMSVRETENSDKADANDSTTAKKYIKQSDDFYDIIKEANHTATTQQIINTAAENYYPNITFQYIGVNDSRSGSVTYSESNTEWKLNKNPEQFESYINAEHALTYENFLPLLEGIDTDAFYSFINDKFSKSSENNPQYIVIPGVQQDLLFKANVIPVSRYALNELYIESPYINITSHNGGVDDSVIEMQSGVIKDFDSGESASVSNIIRAAKIIKNIGFNDNGDILTSAKVCTVTQVEWYDDIDDDTDFTIFRESTSNVPVPGEHSSAETSKIISNIKNALGDSNKNSETGSVEAFEDYIANNQEFMVLYYDVDNTSANKVALKIKSDGGFTTTPISDIVKLVNYMKDNHQGPWANSNN